MLYKNQHKSLKGREKEDWLVTSGPKKQHRAELLSSDLEPKEQWPWNASKQRQEKPHKSLLPLVWDKEGAAEQDGELVSNNHSSQTPQEGQNFDHCPPLRRPPCQTHSRYQGRPRGEQ